MKVKTYFKNRNTFKLLFRFLLSGSHFMLVGWPKQVPPVLLDTLVAEGHKIFAKEADACQFLTNNIAVNFDKAPRLALFYNPQRDQKSIFVAKKRRIFTVAISNDKNLDTDMVLSGSREKNLVLFYLLIIHITRRLCYNRDFL